MCHVVVDLRRSCLFSGIVRKKAERYLQAPIFSIRGFNSCIFSDGFCYRRTGRVEKRGQNMFVWRIGGERTNSVLPC